MEDPVVYEYPRELREDGTWNINNPYDVDVNGFSVTLSTRIMQALPEVTLYEVMLNETTANIKIDELSTEQKTLLDDTVAAHEAATGTINQATKLFLNSPDGTLWSVMIDDTGVLSTQVEG